MTNETTPIFKFAIREDLKDSEFDFLPQKATPRSSGWDVRAAIKSPFIDIEYGEIVKIPLGFRAFCPDGWWLELKPRSSTFVKKRLHCLYGTIDEDYEGELILAAQFIPHLIGYNNTIAGNFDKLRIMFGEALGQIIPVRRQEMIVDRVSNEEYDALCKQRNAERGAGGFGSTGK